MAGQLFVTNSLGGFLSSDFLSDELRTALLPMWQFRQFADARDANFDGQRQGNTFHWDVVGTLARADRALTETNTVGESNFTITQGTLTTSERGQAVPYTGKLEALSKFAIRQPVMKALRADANRDLDALCFTQFDKTCLRYSVAGSSAGVLNSGGSASLTNSIAFNTIHWKDIVDKMKERNIPFYTKRDYVAIGWPSTFRTVKNTLESLHQYTETGLELIFNGEIGRYENTRVVEQTNVPKGGAGDSATYNALTDTSDAWNNALSDWIFFLGEDTVTEGIAVPEEIRAKIPGDYGRSRGIAWYYLGGYGLVHGAFATEGTAPADHAQCRVVKWDSGA
jgi:N4-gp56 family major capsid protein